MRTNVVIRNTDGTLSDEARRLSESIIRGDESAIIAQLEDLTAMAAVTILTDALTNTHRIIRSDDLDPLHRVCGLNYDLR